MHSAGSLLSVGRQCVDLFHAFSLFHWAVWGGNMWICSMHSAGSLLSAGR